MKKSGKRKIRKDEKVEFLVHLIWTFFGFFGGMSYFLKADYFICSIMFLIGILYGYKLVDPIIKYITKIAQNENR